MIWDLNSMLNSLFRPAGNGQNGNGQNPNVTARITRNGKIKQWKNATKTKKYKN
jgi:hypothetical protein